MAQNVVVPPFDVAPETVVGSTPQSIFAFDFPFWSAADLVVLVNGLELAPSAYTVQGYFVQNGQPVEGGYGSGQVTLNTPVTNCTVTLDRLVVAARESQFSRAAPLVMPSLNADINKQTARDQDILRRKVDVPAGDRAGRVLGFDGNGAVRTYPTGSGVVGDADDVMFQAAGLGAIKRTLQNKGRDVVSLKDFGAVEGDIESCTLAVTRAEASAHDAIYVPAGDYPISQNFYGLVKRYSGPGRFLISAGIGAGSTAYPQPGNRVFILTDPTRGDRHNRQRAFEGDIKHLQQPGYIFVDPVVGQVVSDFYTNLFEAGWSFRVMDYNGGANNSATSNAERTMGAMDWLKLYHGGQGDLCARQLYLQGYMNRPGGLHFLAHPAISVEGGLLDAVVPHLYEQHSEFGYVDNGNGIAVIDRTRNYYRTSANATQYEVWIHDRPQSLGSIHGDIIYSPAGLWKRVIDTAALTLDENGAFIASKPDEWWYPHCTATADPVSGTKYLSNLGQTRLGHDGDDMRLELATGEKLVVTGDDHVRIDPTAWTAATLVNSWVPETSVGQSAPKYRRSQGGQVMLKGAAKGGVDGSNAFVLPSGFRPSERVYFQTLTVSGIATVTIDSGGSVFVIAGAGSPKNVGFDGIIFDPA